MRSVAKWSRGILSISISSGNREGRTVVQQSAMTTTRAQTLLMREQDHLSSTETPMRHHDAVTTIMAVITIITITLKDSKVVGVMVTVVTTIKTVTKALAVGFTVVGASEITKVATMNTSSAEEAKVLLHNTEKEVVGSEAPLITLLVIMTVNAMGMCHEVAINNISKKSALPTQGLSVVKIMAHLTISSMGMVTISSVVAIRVGIAPSIIKAMITIANDQILRARD